MTFRPLFARLLPSVAAFLMGGTGFLWSGDPAVPELDLGAEIAKAAREPEAVVRLSPGTYRLPAKGVLIRNVRNLTIEGNGARLIVPQYSAVALRFENCDGVTLKDFTIDYDPLPYTQGNIVAIAPDHRWIEVDVHDGYPDLLPEFNSQRIHFFDGQTLGWKRGTAEGFFRDVERLSPRRAKIKLDPAMLQGKAQLLKVGDMYAITMRGPTVVSFYWCRNIVMEDVTIQAGPGLAIVARNADGDNRFVRCKVERGPTPAGARVPRLISTNCDALNYAYSRKGPLIEDCEFSFMGDDGINLHGPAFQVVHVESPNVVWCLRRTVLKEIKPYYEDILRPGDPVRVLAGENFDIKSEGTIVSLETDLEPPFRLTREEIVQSGPAAKYPAEKYLRLTLSGAAGLTKGDVLDFPAAAASGYVIRGNSIHDVRPRGMRIMASNGVIENNRIARTTQPGICIGGHYAFYREAGWVSNVDIRNNVVEDVGIGADINLGLSPTPGAISVWTETTSGKADRAPTPAGHRNIRITGNQIRDCAAEAIVVSGLRDGLIEGNDIVNCNTVSPQKPFYDGKGQRGRGIVVLDSPGTVVKDNVFASTDSHPHGPVLISPEPAPVQATAAGSSAEGKGFLHAVRAFFARLLGR